LGCLLSVLLLIVGCDTADSEEVEDFFTVRVAEQRVSAGTTLNAALDGSDPRVLDFTDDIRQALIRETFVEDSSHVDVYQLSGSGATDLRLTSPDLDTYLVLFSEAGEIIGENDDDVVSTNSRLISTLDADRTYYLVVSSYNANETGAYTLSGATPTPVPLGIAVEQEIGTGSTVDGALASSDARASDLNDAIIGDVEPEEDIFVDAYSLTGTGAVTLNLRSSEFDTVLLLISEFGQIVDFSDDGPDGSDSRLSVSLSEGERTYVIVSSFLAGETGAYTLTVNGSAAQQLERTTLQRRDTSKGLWRAMGSGVQEAKQRASVR
jgi:hypothetical protein